MRVGCGEPSANPLTRVQAKTLTLALTPTLAPTLALPLTLTLPLHPNFVQMIEHYFQLGKGGLGEPLTNRVVSSK